MRPYGLESLLRDLIFAGSLTVSTLLVYIAWVSIREWWADHAARFERGRALLCLGCAGIVFLVTESIIIRVPSIPVTWESVAYLVSLALSTFGGLAMALNWQRHIDNR